MTIQLPAMAMHDTGHFPHGRRYDDPDGINPRSRDIFGRRSHLRPEADAARRATDPVCPSRIRRRSASETRVDAAICDVAV